MKGFFFSLALLFSFATFAQESPLTFKTVKHSFGKVKHNVPVTATFSFTNTSDKPVVIENATADCGCTSPEYPKGAIAKGKTGTVKVTYNSAAMGAFTKRVHVKVAGLNQPIDLTIEGEVVGVATATGKPKG